jgi:serine/threonine-protein kinase
LKAALADRYAIEREIGSGGMATVYLAHDVKHDRKVAVKVLRPELAAVLGAERFLHEIKVTANLQHPHILPLHDSGEADSFLYYVMPYVEGESLRERLNREKQLSVDDALKLASQVADALGSAHRQGVVHRDIKPENILLREGHAVVADFGIALAVTSAGGERLTETGLSLGTPAYMSPEQVSGDRVIDGRSDIYSLACVLYETLAGDPPFVASSPQAVLSRHVTDPALPVTTVRSSVPPPAAVAIAKALGKAPADRYESAGIFAEALYGTPTELEPERKSIAVLPFENLSADPEQEYFCDGMTEELINALSHIEALKVIARTSAFAFKGQHQDVREIGRQLDVEHLLEGSVRKAGNRLRIAAQLIRTDDGSHLWSERYDRNMDDVFVVQDEITLAIVDTLKARLLTTEREAISKRHTDDSELYNLYLLGRYHWNKFTPDGFDTSESYFEQAIAKDPGFALGYVGVAEVNHLKPFFVDSPPREAIPKAKTHAENALALDAGLAEAHALLGRIYTFYDWTWEEADREYKRALILNPNSANAHIFFASLLSLTGRHDRAVEEARRARELDPLSIFINAIVGERTFHAGRFEEAIADLQNTIAMEQGYYYSHLLLGWAYWESARHQEATSEFETALAGSARTPIVAYNLANAYWLTDSRHQADELLDELEQKAKHQYVPPVYLFSIYNVRGDFDRAFEWFDKAVEEHDIMLPFCLTWPGHWLRMPDEPRFTDALDRLRKPAT